MNGKWHSAFDFLSPNTLGWSGRRAGEGSARAVEWLFTERIRNQFAWPAVISWVLSRFFSESFGVLLKLISSSKRHQLCYTFLWNSILRTLRTTGSLKSKLKRQDAITMLHQPVTIWTVNHNTQKEYKVLQQKKWMFILIHQTQLFRTRLCRKCTVK